MPAFDLESAELVSFRNEVRDYIRANLPEEIRRKVAEERMDLTKEDQRRWHKILLKKGWVCTGWPAEHGGPGWDDGRQYVFEREIALADAPRPLIYGIGMLGPTVMKYGSEAQKRTVLPRIRAGEDFWCQGFSEPNAGSDLASLQTRAERKGDRYIVNGSKLWTSEGHVADRMFCLTRTSSSGKKQHGITFLLIDLDTPGIEIQPVWTFDGGGREVNQVFFSNVEVPVANRLGEENEGWGIAKYLLSLERFGTAEVSRSMATLARLKRFAARHKIGNGVLADDRDFARRIARAEVELKAVELTELRLLFGGGDVGAEASLLKLRGTEIQNRLMELIYEAVGPYANVVAGDLETTKGTPAGPIENRFAAISHFNYRKTLIYSGSNEIQRNIIAKGVLGL